MPENRSLYNYYVRQSDMIYEYFHTKIRSLQLLWSILNVTIAKVLPGKYALLYGTSVAILRGAGNYYGCYNKLLLVWNRDHMDLSTPRGYPSTLKFIPRVGLEVTSVPIQDPEVLLVVLEDGSVAQPSHLGQGIPVLARWLQGIIGRGNNIGIRS